MQVLIKYFGLNASLIGTPQIHNEIKRIKDMINDMYWSLHMSSTEICNYFNYPSNSNFTNKLLVWLNIPKKTISQSISENYIFNRKHVSSSPLYKTYKHMAWDGKIVYLRSSYELDFAISLDAQRIKYNVECLRIKYFNTTKNEYHCAIPDFYLPDTNEIIEIKSIWTLKNHVLEMKVKFKEYINLGYIPKLILEHKEVSIDMLSEENLS